MCVEVSRDVLFVFAVLERHTHISPKFLGIGECLKDSRPISSIMLRGSKKMSLEQNAKNKTGGFRGKKKEMACYNAYIAIQEHHHYKTSQVKLFSVKELS